MIDPVAGLTILGGAIGGAKMVEKILGPTSEYIGDQLKEWTIKSVTNTSNIFKNAEKKLGNKLNQPGKVPPKVLKSILEDGAWCEEELQVEYFGGVLASSRTGISRDDRGACYTALISRLSTYQLRTHFLFYQLVKKLFNNCTVNIHDGNNTRELQVFLPFDTFIDAMDFTKEEADNWFNILSHTIWGLNKEELILNFSWGDHEHIKKKFPQAETGGIVFQPTKIGTELFMWAYGHGQLDPSLFFSSQLTFPNEQKLKLGVAVSTKKAKDEENEGRKKTIAKKI
jgi:hypothetical protein